MLKKHMAACLVATAFMAAPALAQTSNQSGSMSSSSSASMQSGQFMTHMQQNQWRASKLVGVNIYGQNNEKIGDVNEVLIDRNGNADAVVIGVGGFLGIGEKDVAVPFSGIQWKYDRNDLHTASTNRPATTGTTAANPPASGAMATNPPTTGTTAANRPATADNNMDRGYPDHGMLNMTKDQLKSAPTFRYSMNDNNNAGNANRASTSTAPATTSPPAATNPPATAPKQ
jgi:sporulation protein YlmC with PRC-barrel domain